MPAPGRTRADLRRPPSAAQQEPDQRCGEGELADAEGDSHVDRPKQLGEAEAGEERGKDRDQLGAGRQGASV